MDDLAGSLDAFLAAQLEFELSRWDGEALAETVEQEVTDLFEALHALTLADLLPADRVEQYPRQLLAWLADPTQDLIDLVENGLRDGYNFLVGDDTQLSQLLPRADYDKLGNAVIGLTAVRQEVIRQLTTSTAYSKLIAHVLYQGLKNYALNENVVARRVPGASSLIRMGQSAVRSASPNLERNVDKALIGFVNSNIAETIRDSREFLETVLDEPMMQTIAEELWSMNADRTTGELTDLVGPESFEEVLAAGRDAVLRLLAGEELPRLADQLLDGVLTAHGATPLDELLGDLGITADLVTKELQPVAADLAGVLRASGYLEARARRRSDAFAAWYRSGAR
jgi:hypothetical protein